MSNTNFVNYFEVLNVSEQAEIEVIRSAYKTLVKKYHPDTATLPKQEADSKMALLNEAYYVLSDEERRKNYISELQNLEAVNSQRFNKNHNVSDDYQDNKTSTTQEEDPPGIVAYIVLILIVIVIIGCGIRFLPDLLRVTWNNIVESLKEIWATFC